MEARNGKGCKRCNYHKCQVDEVGMLLNLLATQRKVGARREDFAKWTRKPGAF